MDLRQGKQKQKKKTKGKVKRNTVTTTRKKIGKRKHPKKEMTQTDHTSQIQSMQAYSEMLKKMDADGSLSSMLLKEQLNPGIMLPQDQQRMLREGKKALFCDVLRAVVNYTLV